MSNPTFIQVVCALAEVSIEAFMSAARGIFWFRWSDSTDGMEAEDAVEKAIGEMPNSDAGSDD